MITKFFRWLSSPRKSPIMRGSATVDAWGQLQDMGYTVESYQPDQDNKNNKGLRCYSFWCNGQLMSEEWSLPITLDEFYRMRRLWSVDELARVQKEEQWKR